MRKIAILFLVFCSITLFAQRAQHDDLLLRRNPRLHNFDPLKHHCSKYDVKRFLRASHERDHKKSIFYNSGAAQLQYSGTTWNPIGPEGGNIIGISFNPMNNNEIYAVAYGYPSLIFKAVNSGQTWEKIGTLEDYVYDIAVDPTNPEVIYVSSSSSIYKSIDGGTNWQNYQFSSKFYGYPGKIAINPDNSIILYVAGYYYDYDSDLGCMAILKSVDGGENWTGIKILPSSQAGFVYCIAIDPLNPGNLYAGGYYYDGSNVYGKLFKTTDGGENWTDITGSIIGYPEAIAIDPTNPLKVYVGTYWGVFRSTNGGQSWQKNNGYVYAYALAIDLLNPNILYAGYIGNCYKSTDGGINWLEYSEGIYGLCNKILVSSASLNQVFYGSYAGIYKSEDGGVSWNTRHSGIKANEIPALAVPSSPNIVYAEVAGNGLFKSNDFGNSWERLPDFYRCESITKIALNPNNADELFILAGG